MRHLFFFFFFFFFFFSLSPMAATTSYNPHPPIIGITFNPNSPNLLPTDRIVSSLHSAGVSHLLLIDPSPSTLRSFLYSSISLLISLPSNLSSSSSFNLYLSHHLLPFHPRIHISALLLPFHQNLNLSSSSFHTLRSSLSSLGLPHFPISTVLPFESLLSPSFPPSAARFGSETLIRPLLQFLSSTRSPFLVHLFPFHLYRTQPEIPIGFAMFDCEAFSFRDDPGSGLRYRNLFDEMVDSVFSALEKMGYRDMPVVVAGTGWPTGGQKEAATVEYAKRYNWGVVEHVRSGLGTPMRRGGVQGVYVHEVFDEMNKSSGGEEWERHWGIWYHNLSAKYDVGFLSSGGGGANVNVTTAVVVTVWWLMVAAAAFLLRL